MVLEGDDDGIWGGLEAMVPNGLDAGLIRGARNIFGA